MSEEEILSLNRKINDLEKDYIKYKNILTEFEKWLEEETEKYSHSLRGGKTYNLALNHILDKLQELKGGKK